MKKLSAKKEKELRELFNQYCSAISFSDIQLHKIEFERGGVSSLEYASESVRNKELRAKQLEIGAQL